MRVGSATGWCAGLVEVQHFASPSRQIVYTAYDAVPVRFFIGLGMVHQEKTTNTPNICLLL